MAGRAGRTERFSKHTSNKRDTGYGADGSARSVMLLPGMGKRAR